MSKSAREDRPWKYSGQFRLGSPVRESEIKKHIVEGCECSACKANREWLNKVQQWNTNK